MFKGFAQPGDSSYRLPRGWFDLWRDVRTDRIKRRLTGPLKITEYIIARTWGYQNFDRAVRITRRDFRNGAGLAFNTIEDALEFVEEHKIITIHGTRQSPSFLPCLERLDPPTEESGFTVPSSWMSIVHDVDQSALILAMEYFFCHTWECEDGEDECWMDTDDLSRGYRCRSVDHYERCDNGIGYSEQHLRDVMTDAVRRGWLRKRGGQGYMERPEYALRIEMADQPGSRETTPAMPVAMPVTQLGFSAM
jgi:hypothetical protein